MDHMTCDGIIIDRHDIAILTHPKTKWPLASLELQKYDLLCSDRGHRFSPSSMIIYINIGILWFSNKLRALGEKGIDKIMKILDHIPS